jgi:hypothetical protein
MTIVADIIRQLEKDGPLRDPFEWRHREDMGDKYVADDYVAKYVAREVQRSIDRIKERLKYKPDKPLPPPAEWKKLGQQLRKMRMSVEVDQRENMNDPPRYVRLPDDFFDKVRQEPPPRTKDALPYICADEAFYLMEMFSAGQPTQYREGPFYTIARKLYEAASRKPARNIDRACDWIWNERHSVPRRGINPLT